ncbi:histidine-type phosphatase [Vibrio sp. CAIM 722]|uniref:Histidine-type phosphatase n=1 Tax=Vibrio eleionomae TaxID=2653505 RepID=A0A7X4LKX1_9VIBR|nr:histidine-type phosphatase [Vibrio eleionomae]MZI93858.1 histidine-type phosphatase [Vibrio eleionomae]
MSIKQAMPIAAALLVGLMGSISSASASEWTLDKVVSLSRHGVRPQTNTEKLDKATGKSWPKFEVADGTLTGHGYTGIWQQAKYQLKQWNDEGLNITHHCSSQEQVFLWTSPSQRIIATGKAMADGMFPGCGIAPLHVNAEYGPLFELYHLHAMHADPAVMKKQIMARIGDPKQAAEKYQKDVEALRHTVCAQDSCEFLDKKWGIKFKDTGKPSLKGPGKVGATIGETIRLQYSDNLPIKGVAFGHGKDAASVKALMGIHAAQYDLALTTPEFAAHSGSLLMKQMVSAIAAGTPLAKQWHGDKRLERPLVMLVGHDSNIAEIQTMLGFSWSLPQYPSNDIPPGGTLSMARFHKSASDKEFVRVRFTARTLDQWRSLAPLNASNPLPYADLNFKGCESTDVGVLCPIDAVVKRATNLLVKDGSELPVFKS